MRFLNRGSLKGEKATASTTLSSYLSPGSAARILVRLAQFVMGLVVIGLYAQDLDHARKAHKYADPKWAYAVFCGGWGALLALVFMLPLVKSWFFFYVDALAAFFYLVLFGIFGEMFIKEDPEGNKGIVRMKHAVWVDLTNVLLWLGTAIYGAVVFWRSRKARTLHTGRAASHV